MQTFPDAADVGVVHVGIHLHLGQVLRDCEERGRLEARGHRLADIHGTRDHDAVHGRADLRVVEIDLGLLEASLLLNDVGAGRLQHGLGHLELRFGGSNLGGLGDFLRLGRLGLGDGRVVRGLRRILVGLGDEAALSQVRVAGKGASAVDHGDLGLGGLRLGHGEGRLGIGEVRSGLLDQGPLVEDGRLGRVHLGLGLGHRGLELLGVDPGHELVALDLGVEVREELLDLPRDLGADLDGDDGVERARGRDGGGERPPLDLGRAEAGRAAAALRVEPRAAGARGQHDHHDHDPRTTTHSHETTLRGALFLEAGGAPEGSGALRAG